MHVCFFYTIPSFRLPKEIILESTGCTMFLKIYLLINAFYSSLKRNIIIFNENTKFVFSIFLKFTEMMTRQLLSNKNYLTDSNEILDPIFLRLTLYKDDKDFIIVTLSYHQAQDFSNDLIMGNCDNQ